MYLAWGRFLLLSLNYLLFLLVLYVLFFSNVFTVLDLHGNSDTNIRILVNISTPERKTKQCLFPGPYFSWDFRQSWLVVGYRHFGTAYRSHLRGSSIPTTMGKMGSPETANLLRVTFRKTRASTLRLKPEISQFAFLFCEKLIIFFRVKNLFEWAYD